MAAASRIRRLAWAAAVLLGSCLSLVCALDIPPSGPLPLKNGVYVSDKQVPPGWAATGLKATWDIVGTNPVLGVNLAQVPGKDDAYLCLGRQGFYKDEKSASRFDLPTRKFTNITVATNPFCSSVAPIHDGRMANFGGHSGTPVSGIADGKNGIRIFNFNINPTFLPQSGHMWYNRWYPTATLLPNHKVFISGGTIRPNEFSEAAPYDEIWDPAVPLDTPLFKMPVDPEYLKVTRQNFYPFVYVLPSGELFTHCQGLTRIRKLDGSYRTNPATGKPLEIPGFSDVVTTQFPRSGSSVLAALRPDAAGQYTSVDIYIFGGQKKTHMCNFTNVHNTIASNSKMWKLRISMRRNQGGDWQYTFGNGGKLWEEEDMYIPRVGSDMVLLPNGDFMIVNGAQTGCCGNTKDGIPRSSYPAFWPQLYQPDKPAGKRMTIMPASRLARMYHSSAALTLDGNVLIAGCDACGAGREGRGIMTPARYTFWDQIVSRFERRVEVFKTPYYYDEAAKPKIVTINGKAGQGVASVLFGAEVAIAYKGQATAVSLVAPSSSTHGFNSNQRVVFLPITSNKGGVIKVRIPSNNNVLPPQFYMLFVMNGKTYSRARWVRVREKL